MAEVKLRLTQSQHQELFKHLFPGDGLEAVALALCGRRSHRDRHWLMVHRIEPIPYVECSVRRPDFVKWSTERLVPLLEEAREKGWGILKIHCHPNGYPSFSDIDDQTDRDLFASISTWTETDLPHVSMIMLPDRRLFGRAFDGKGQVDTIQSVLVTGDDIEIWLPSRPGKLSKFTQRHEQLFGAGTTERLRHMTVAVIGCSGTGSPVIELLARLGVGEMIIVDPDVIEEKNLNRIINSNRLDSYLERPKVQVSARSIAAMGFDTSVRIFQQSLFENDVIKAVAQADVIFGCVDSVEARNVLNRIATFYSIPYFDLGIKLEADGVGGIDEAVGAVHYLRPDGNTLLERGAYTVGQLSAEGLKRTDPTAYEEQLEAGYIGGVREDRPAVISINCQIASMAVNEFLARLHPFRLDNNDQSAILRVNFVGGEIYREPEGTNGHRLSKYIGRGDAVPPLAMPALG